jgi:hypothetical protein
VIVDLMKCIKLLREHAGEWGVNPGQIVISGNSAGAFICMTTGNLWKPGRTSWSGRGCRGEEGRPDAMILGFGPMFCGQQTDGNIVYCSQRRACRAPDAAGVFHHARLGRSRLRLPDDSHARRHGKGKTPLRGIHIGHGRARRNRLRKPHARRGRNSRPLH